MAACYTFLMKKTIIVVLGFVILIALFTATKHYSYSSSRVPEGFTLEESFQSGVSLTSLYSADEIRVKVTRTQELQSASVSQWLERDQLRFLGSFSPSISPYPGAISDSLVCEEEYIPTITSTPSYSYAHTNASSRYTFGVCDPFTVAYQALVFWQRCSDNTANRVEYIYPTSHPSVEASLLEEWSCL